MRIIRSLDDVQSTDRGTSAAIGNFDGVHIGHRAVIESARSNGPLSVLTFEPHPRQIFQPDAPAFRLTDSAARASRLEKIGVQTLFELPFDSLRPLSAEAFCSDVLAEGLGISHATVGADFRFGAGRAGTPDVLRNAGASLGFGVTIADLVSRDTSEVSSTAIRAALSNGDPEAAADMLGHWHRIEGPVLHGEKRGRDLGYPTANMSLDGLHLPKFGVYAVLVDVLNGAHAGRFTGAASLGVRPMFGENRPNLETFIFDFSGDLYGADLSVALVAFLRPELAFDGIDSLIMQMEKDCAEARVRLGGQQD